MYENIKCNINGFGIFIIILYYFTVYLATTCIVINARVKYKLYYINKLHVIDLLVAKGLRTFSAISVLAILLDLFLPKTFLFFPKRTYNNRPVKQS